MWAAGFGQRVPTRCSTTCQLMEMALPFDVNACSAKPVGTGGGRRMGGVTGAGGSRCCWCPRPVSHMPPSRMYALKSSNICQQLPPPSVRALGSPRRVLRQGRQGGHGRRQAGRPSRIPRVDCMPALSQRSSRDRARGSSSACAMLLVSLVASWVALLGGYGRSRGGRRCALGALTPSACLKKATWNPAGNLFAFMLSACVAMLRRWQTQGMSLASGCLLDGTTSAGPMGHGPCLPSSAEVQAQRPLSRAVGLFPLAL